jgi:predicted RNase H-like nuclease (RuvC/YqgF family)
MGLLAHCVISRHRSKRSLSGYSDRANRRCAENTIISTQRREAISYDDELKIGELQDQLKHRDRRIEELRRELDESRDLVRRMEEDVEDASSVIESWCETFDIEQTADGWTWKPFWEEHWAMIASYNELVHR